MGITRHATAVWAGDLASGSGMVTYVSSGAYTRLPVTWASRTGQHNGKATPEEFLAAAHASCFSMSFASRLAKNGATSDRVEVTVTIGFEQVEGAWTVASSTIRVSAVAPGMDPATFQALAEDARDKCPISRALKGNVAISVEATLLPA
jgi:osmotically inducible protein OsmC